MTNKFDEIVLPTATRLDCAQTRESKRKVVVFNFVEETFGFGEITLIAEPDGSTFIDTEMMSMGKVKALIGRWLDDAISDTDQDPERHRLYNEAMGVGAAAAARSAIRETLATSRSCRGPY